MIDEEMNSSYGEEDSVQDESKQDQDQIMEANSESQQDQPDEAIGHFDEFGQFKYHNYNYIHKDQKKTGKTHIDLKNLSEQNFLDLIEAKNQDKRFYSWLHFHPLFDDEDWESDDGFGKNKKAKPRRGSEQVNLDSRLDCEP